MKFFLNFLFPMFVINFLEVTFDIDYSSGPIFFVKSSMNEYEIIYADDIYKHITHRLMVNAETDEIFSHRIMFKDNIRFFKQLSNNLNFYTFSSYSLIEKYEKNNTSKYIDYVGSQVYIDGGLQTRGIKRNITCECGEKFKAADMVTEIVPYSVEYLNHCNFDD